MKQEENGRTGTSNEIVELDIDGDWVGHRRASISNSSRQQGVLTPRLRYHAAGAIVKGQGIGL